MRRPASCWLLPIGPQFTATVRCERTTSGNRFTLSFCCLRGNVAAGSNLEVPYSEPRSWWIDGIHLRYLAHFPLPTCLFSYRNSSLKVEMAAQDFGACGAHSFEVVRVTAKKNTSNGFNIACHLPPGVQQIASTVGIIGGPSGCLIAEIEISNLNHPVFAIETGYS